MISQTLFKFRCNFLRVIFLVFLCVFCQAQYQNSSEHICERITKGQFDRIQINSITWSTAETLHLYEGGKMMYQVKKRWITTNSLDLRRTKPKEVKSYYSDIVPELNSFSAIHHFHPSFLRHGMLVRVDSNETMYDLHRRRVVWNRVGYASEYSIQSAENGQYVTANAVSRDVCDATYNFVIYQILVAPNLTVERIHRINPTAADISQAKFFYLQKSRSSSFEAILAHPKASNVQDASHQMFDSLPPGFMHSGALHLFDTTLGCVNVFPDWSSLSLDSQFDASRKNIKLPRIPITYEVYFKCPNEISAEFPHLRNRCKTKVPKTTTTSQTSKPQPPNIEQPTTAHHDPSPTLPDNDFFNQMLAAISGICLVAAVCCCICCIEYIRARAGRMKKSSRRSFFKPFMTVSRLGTNTRGKTSLAITTGSSTSSSSKSSSHLAKNSKALRNTSKSPKCSPRKPRGKIHANMPHKKRSKCAIRVTS